MIIIDDAKNKEADHGLIHTQWWRIVIIVDGCIDTYVVLQRGLDCWGFYYYFWTRNAQSSW